VQISKHKATLSIYAQLSFYLTFGEIEAKPFLSLACFFTFYLTFVYLLLSMLAYIHKQALA
jgi:hypothetical protein